MSETNERAALITEAERMSRYVQNGGPDDGTVYDRLAVALAESEREAARLLELLDRIRAEVNYVRAIDADFEYYIRDLPGEILRILEDVSTSAKAE